MQLRLASVILSVLLACHATPSPAHYGPGRKQDKYFADPSGRAVGAVYTLTDEPTGNFIIGADIGSDGQLTLRRAIYAGGVGAHGLHDLGPDPLFSQGSVQLNSEKNVLVTVNPGSNTIAAFSIDPKDPTNLEMLGKPVDSYGEFPASVALNKAADRACIINSGSVDGVSCYTLDKHKGLRPIANTVRRVGLNQTTPPTGTSGTLSNIIFSEDETKLYVAVKGTDPAINVDVHPGFFAVWDIRKDGSLSKKFTTIPVAEGGKQPFAMTPIPNEKAIFGADGAAGFYVWDLSTIDEGIQGPRSSVTPVVGQSSVCWSGYSPGTGNFYVVDGVISNITQVTLDKNLKPTTIQNFPQNIFDSTIDFDIASVNNKDHMYLLAANATALRVIQLASNDMTQVQSLDLSGPAKGVGLTVDPNNLQGMKVYLK